MALNSCFRLMEYYGVCLVKVFYANASSSSSVLFSEKERLIKEGKKEIMTLLYVGKLEVNLVRWQV